MAAELVVEARAGALEYHPSTQAAAILEGFFESDAAARTFSNPTVLADCRFFDLPISYYMRNWPGKHHPGIFEEFFPLILERLISPQNVLTLSIRDDYGLGYFDSGRHVDTQLSPRGLAHVFLPGLKITTPGGLIRPEKLVFEWPTDSLDYILEEHWLYYGPFVETEGYVSKGPLLDSITRLHSQPDTERRLRELLRATEFCFKPWPDGNGLFLLTDKFDFDALNHRLRLDELNALIQESARCWDREA